MRVITHTPGWVPDSDCEPEAAFDPYAGANSSFGPDEELELLKSYAQVARDLAARGRMTESYETLQQIRRRWPDLGGLLGFRRGQP